MKHSGVQQTPTQTLLHGAQAFELQETLDMNVAGIRIVSAVLLLLACFGRTTIGFVHRYRGLVMVSRNGRLLEDGFNR